MLTHSNTMDHNNLLRILRRSFVIDATALGWYESCVIGRTQAVNLSDTMTSQLPLVCGVPHLSVLGLPFYTAGSGYIISAHGLLQHCNAHKIQIYFYCRPSECAVLKGKVHSSVCDQQAVSHNITKREYYTFDCYFQTCRQCTQPWRFLDANMNYKDANLVSSCYYQLQKDTVN